MSIFREPDWLAMSENDLFISIASVCKLDKFRSLCFEDLCIVKPWIRLSHGDQNFVQRIPKGSIILYWSLSHRRTVSLSHPFKLLILIYSFNSFLGKFQEPTRRRKLSSFKSNCHHPVNSYGINLCWNVERWRTENDFFAFKKNQINNLFLHQPYLKSPLPVKLSW